MDGLLQEILTCEKIFLGEDLNGHIGKDNGRYEREREARGFGQKNELGGIVLDFALAFNL